LERRSGHCRGNVPKRSLIVTRGIPSCPSSRVSDTKLFPRAASPQHSRIRRATRRSRFRAFRLCPVYSFAGKRFRPALTTARRERFLENGPPCLLPRRLNRMPIRTRVHFLIIRTVSPTTTFFAKNYARTCIVTANHALSSRARSYTERVPSDHYYLEFVNFPFRPPSRTSRTHSPTLLSSGVRRNGSKVNYANYTKKRLRGARRSRTK